MRPRLLLAICLLSMLAATSSARPPAGAAPRARPQTTQVIDAQHYVDANSLLGFVTNFGNLFYDAEQMFGRNDGLYYPYTGIDHILGHQDDKTVLFNAGLWMGGKVNGQIRIATAEYGTEYVPGPMINGTFDPNFSKPAYRVYKIYADSLGGNPNIDYLGWPIGQGAPVDLYGHPLLLGDQTLFSVYNDADPAQHQNGGGATQPLGIEVRQTVWAEALSGPAMTTINVRYDLYNKGTNQITDCYLSLWSDPDVGQYNNDLVGCDTIAGIYYCYSTGTDDVYGSNAPAVGLRIIRGPIVTSPGDTANFFGRNLPGYRNLQPSAFARFINGTDPLEAAQTYNCMRGLYANGLPYTYNGTPTKFFVSGDPIAGTGDLDVSPADRRMMVSIGPFNFYPGDSQQLIVKWGVGQGTSALNSVSVLRNQVLNDPHCCVGTTGNIDGIGSIDLTDLSLLVTYLANTPRPVLPCPAAANIDRLGIIDLSDLSWLIAYLTVTPRPVLPNCP